MADSGQQPAGAPAAAAAPGITAAALRTPNLYQVSGHHLHVTYSTSGFDGRPHFTYQDATQVLSFTGDQIRTDQTEIGTLVSVTIHLTVDSGSTTFTLLVPRVNLGPSNQAPIATEGITTLNRFSLVPVLDLGQTQRYSVVALTGTASLVAF
jgi:hypothetical protein